MTAENQNVTPENEDQAEEVPAWLRTLVAVLGVAIVVMIALIVGTIVKKAMKDDDDTAVVAGQPAEITAVSESVTVKKQIALQPVTDGGTVMDITVTRPEGANLLYSQIVGDEMLLHFKLADGGDMLMTVDRNTGLVRRVTIPVSGN